MTNGNSKNRRRSIRLKGYDYSQAGAYFITICTGGRACLFGEIAGTEMRLNDREWRDSVGAPFPIIFRWWNWTNL
ncbi:hypothetical protein [Methylomicrobium album]|uniref:hypothetical protein n=1 Tax=Methylomicrobium album TaxID=39775 RepID=UPI001BC89162|nr:hypothetical protein [Methylomicrobium album]